MDFKNHIYKFLDKIKNKENFSVSRFSDGEMFMLQGKNIQLHQDLNYVEGKYKTGQSRPVYDTKHFDPSTDISFVRHLEKTINHKQDNYYKGICCRCCVGQFDFEWQFNFVSEDDNLTWANIFVNSNYPIFMEEVLPEIQKRDCVFVCNEHANLDKQDWIKKDFRISSEKAFINDLHIIDEIDNYISTNNVTDTIFLFSASAFSNLAIYELFKKYPNNTYLDIGTTINKMVGIPVDRGYLSEWDRNGSNGEYKRCIW